jgi:hypothetical protein
LLIDGLFGLIVTAPSVWVGLIGFYARDIWGAERTLSEEFEYHVQLKAIEAFYNIMQREGVALPGMTGFSLSFTSEKRLDMKRLKDRGIIRSYKVTRVRHEEEVVEEG